MKPGSPLHFEALAAAVASALARPALDSPLIAPDGRPFTRAEVDWRTGAIRWTTYVPPC